MKPIYSAAASVALILFSVSAGQAASKAKDDSPSAQARTMLAQVDSWSASIADTADWLSMKAKSQADSQSEQAELANLKDEVNKIGRDLRVLEGEQGDLDKWESSAIDEILPLMQEVAANTEKAIQTFQSDRNHLWATAFPADTAKVFEDAERVKELLDGRLKLAAAHEQEQRLESTLDANQ
jgi:hypothetical protein